MNAGLRELLGRLRGGLPERWPWSTNGLVPIRTSVPHDETGWTVHRDLPLRLKNLSFEELESSVGSPGMAVGAFKIRLAAAPQARREAGNLVQQRYSSRGYQTSATMINRNVCTFAAYDEGRVAGTVSLRLDSRNGLAADQLYRAEIDAMRDNGQKICEFTRLAVDASAVSRPVLAGLFHTVYLFARNVRGFDFVVIEVNPRHVGYYQRSLGFEILGEERHNLRVNAPAVLMGMSFRKIGENMHRYAGKGSRPHTPSAGATRVGVTKAAMQRSFYVYGFSPAEEAGILVRLRRIDRQSARRPKSESGYGTPASI